MVYGAEFRAETHALCSRVKSRNTQFPEHYPHMPSKAAQGILRLLISRAYVNKNRRKVEVLNLRIFSPKSAGH